MESRAIKKEGKLNSIFATNADIQKSKELRLREYRGCDCFIEKRIVALDTLSKKAADALVDSQDTQCFHNSF